MRRTRRIVALSLLGGLGLVGVAGWLTGFFTPIVLQAQSVWEGLQTWLQQPFDLSHVLAVGGAALLPGAIVLLIVLAIADR